MNTTIKNIGLAALFVLTVHLRASDRVGGLHLETRQIVPYFFRLCYVIEVLGISAMDVFLMSDQEIEQLSFKGNPSAQQTQKSNLCRRLVRNLAIRDRDLVKKLGAITVEELRILEFKAAMAWLLEERYIANSFLNQGRLAVLKDPYGLEEYYKEFRRKKYEVCELRGER